MKKSQKTVETLSRINLDGTELEYNLKRSSRSTISIMITNTGQVIVSCPLQTPFVYIEKLLFEKERWIVQKLDEIREKPSAIIKKSFNNGDLFYYLGKPYKLKLVENNITQKPKVRFEEELMVLEISETEDKDKIKSFLKNWYKSKAGELLVERIRIYSSLIGLSPKKVAIKEQKTRWGSCSSKGNINLNWKLIMSPLPVLDYVVIHELCHMKEMNHSGNFWGLVEAVMPDYKVYRKWLKENGCNLSIE
ncbi:M48 family metallopeptidase [Ruminiclostridium papyrosolvens]|uniref:YgjP-like metallopeptidase domain-containing protein n=1 Tax=Ruminiclostridium papyrosolvens C7 TaxID=1330534 RepID=U4R360_9FIRM|nr:SprT family zinc-dependent metalloprotease [Ruminiclostridium papyrosolvens]EPR12929.1 hypothetical protein L323_06410 [Ruminiclostridium papyrosolvens C7]